MGVACAEKTELNPQKSQDETVTRMTMLPCAHRLKGHGDPLHLAILHPHCPMRELPWQQVWLRDILALRVQHLQKGGDAVTWRERKSKSWRAEQGKEAHWSKEMKKKPNQQPKMRAPRESQDPFVHSCFPLPLWFAKTLQVSASWLSAAVA